MATPTQQASSPELKYERRSEELLTEPAKKEQQCTSIPR